MTDPVTSELVKLRRTYRLQNRRCVIRVHANNFERLVRAAHTRNVEPIWLLARIVTAVIEGDLINAVLDDDE